MLFFPMSMFFFNLVSETCEINQFQSHVIRTLLLWQDASGSFYFAGCIIDCSLFLQDAAFCSLASDHVHALKGSLLCESFIPSCSHGEFKRQLKTSHCRSSGP